jgi:transaldolase
VGEKVKLNITLVFTLQQALMMSKLGVKYISPFVGRWDDIDVDGSKLLYEIRHMLDEYGYHTGLLAASLRHVPHFHEAIMAGADVATLPVSVLEQATRHILTDQGIEKFDHDWKKLGVRTFP